MHRSIDWFLAALAIAFLTGCGGGGGGGGSTAPENGGNNPQTTGLIPAVPSPGAVLFEDAAVLRPSREGATWRYRGEQVTQAGAAPQRYETLTTHALASATSVEERTSNSGNGREADQERITVSSGEVSWTSAVDFTGKGSPGQLRFVELRSPVRVGDQYTILDQRFADTAINVDSDALADALDVAIHVRVVGLETVSLANLPPMQAVRTEMVVQSRVIPSISKTPGPIVTVTLSTWYAPGVGIARQTTRGPNNNGGQETTDEQLVSWDGLTSGVGAMAARALVVPASNAVFPNQALGASFDLRVVGFDNHALVVTSAPGSFGSSLVSKIDPAGQVVHSRLLANYMMHGIRRTLPHRNGIVFLEPEPNGNAMQVTLTRLDSEGTLIGAVQGITLDLSGNHQINSAVRAEGAVDENGTLWLLFLREYRDLPNPGDAELALRGYALDGSLRVPERIIVPSFALNQQLSAAGGQVLMSWLGGPQGNDIFVARAGETGPALIRTLASGLPGGNSFLTPMRLGTTNAVMWPAELGSGRNLGAAGGVLFNEAFEIVRAGPDLLAEQVPWMPPYDSGTSGPQSRGARIGLAAAVNNRLWPDDLTDSLVNVVGWVDISAGPLARHPARSVRYGGPPVRGHAVFADRILVFGYDNGNLVATVVWAPQR